MADLQTNITPFEAMTYNEIRRQLSAYVILKMAHRGSPGNPVTYTFEETQEEITKTMRDALAKYLRDQVVQCPVL